MRTWFDKLTIGFVIVFSLPTALVILTWNSLPGNFDYPIKLAMEKLLLLIVSPSYAATGNLNVKYTERRSDEAARLLETTQSGVGLVFLANQVTETKSTILAGSDRSTKKQLVERYVKALEQTNTKLEAQKQTMIATQSEQPERTRIQASPTLRPETQYVPPQLSKPPPTPTPVVATPTPTPTPTESPQEVIDEIEETQDLIEETIDDLNKVTVSQAQEQESQGQEHVDQRDAGNQEQRGQGQEQGQGQRNKEGQGQGQRNEDQRRGNGGQGRD